MSVNNLIFSFRYKKNIFNIHCKYLFQVFCKNKLYVKLAKCHLTKNELKYLSRGKCINGIKR